MNTTRTEQPTDARTTFPPSTTTVLTDAGLETWLIFGRGVDLPAFASYPLAGSDAGRRLLTEYYETYASIAAAAGTAIVLEAPTWRANPDWAATLGHDTDTLSELIDAAMGVVIDVRASWTGSEPFLVSGNVGPRGDGYQIDRRMSADEAQAYHSFQIDRMVAAGADVITAMTLGYVEEAVGVARAAAAAGVPSVISFTVETDGMLPSGMPLAEAVVATDDATRDQGAEPHHYMVNCAHPTHFDRVFDGGDWVRRIGGIRANASTLSHAELDEMVELDAGDPADLAARYVSLRRALPSLHVLGGCCGTDERHVAAMAAAWRT